MTLGRAPHLGWTVRGSLPPAAAWRCPRAVPAPDPPPDLPLPPSPSAGWAPRASFPLHAS